jgi:hypothetical protein
VTNTVTPASRDRSRRALSKAALTCAAALSASAGLGLLGGTTARAQHFEYTIDMVGDPALANTNGTRSFPQPYLINNVGMVAGNQSVSTSDNDGFIGTQAWFFDNTLLRIGLIDAEHTGNTGATPAFPTPSNVTLQDSTVKFLTNVATENVTTDTGYVGGEAKQFLGGSIQTGQSAWLYSVADDQTIRLGLIDSSPTLPSHTTSAGERTSRLMGVNIFGIAAGESDRFLPNGSNPSTAFGKSAWIQPYSDASATLIGLGITPGDTEHRTSTGRWDNTVISINDLGDVVGTATRYNNGTTNLGTSLWQRTTDGNTTKLGFTDAEHTKPTDNRKDTRFVAMNAEGTVVGHSDRYDGSTLTHGQSAWIQHRGQTLPTQLGFVPNTANEFFTVDPGAGQPKTRSSTVLKVVDGNYAAGTSVRYRSATDTTTAGLAAWMYSESNPLQRIGLIDSADHEGIIGGVSNKSSTVVQVAQIKLSDDTLTGVAVGTSLRYIGAPGVRTQSGQSAWRYQDGTANTLRIGLTGGEFSNTNGTESSSIATPTATFNPVNAVGDVVGTSLRYSTEAGQASTGKAAWFFDHTTVDTTPTTERIGLIGGAYDGSRTDNGVAQVLQDSTVSFLNNFGQAAGTSVRYVSNTATTNGQGGWFFDGDQTFELVFSQTSAGLAQTNVSFLSDTGVVLGTYTKYAGDDSVIGTFAFLWDSTITNPAQRFYELGDLVEGGLSANGWATLNNVIKMSDSGRIIGSGILANESGGGGMQFVLTPVPEPAGVALLAATGVLMLPRRRRSR